MRGINSWIKFFLNSKNLALSFERHSRLVAESSRLNAKGFVKINLEIKINNRKFEANK